MIFINHKYNYKIASKFFYVSILCFILLNSSCARKVNFNISNVVPAAEGKVKVKKDNNNNYSVFVEIENLAKPERLQQPKQMYVVWIETKKNGVKNLGQLKTSTSFFSNLLKASLETNTPYYPIRLFITAEDSSNILLPGSNVILNTNNF